MLCGFAALAPYMQTPVMPDPGDTWYASGLFPAVEKGSYWPTSRAQDFKTLADLIKKSCKGQVTWNRTAS